MEHTHGHLMATELSNKLPILPAAPPPLTGEHIVCECCYAINDDQPAQPPNQINYPLELI